MGRLKPTSGRTSHACLLLWPEHAGSSRHTQGQWLLLVPNAGCQIAWPAYPPPHSSLVLSGVRQVGVAQHVAVEKGAAPAPWDRTAAPAYCSPCGQPPTWQWPPAAQRRQAAQCASSAALPAAGSTPRAAACPAPGVVRWRSADKRDIQQGAHGMTPDAHELCAVEVCCDNFSTSALPPAAHLASDGLDALQHRQQLHILRQVLGLLAVRLQGRAQERREGAGYASKAAELRLLGWAGHWADLPATGGCPHHHEHMQKAQALLVCAIPRHCRQSGQYCSRPFWTAPAPGPTSTRYCCSRMLQTTSSHQQCSSTFCTKLADTRACGSRAEARAATSSTGASSCGGRGGEGGCVSTVWLPNPQLEIADGRL